MSLMSMPEAQLKFRGRSPRKARNLPMQRGMIKFISTIPILHGWTGGLGISRPLLNCLCRAAWSGSRRFRFQWTCRAISESWFLLMPIIMWRKALREKPTIQPMDRCSSMSSIQTLRLKVLPLQLPALPGGRLRCNGLSTTRVTLLHRFATGTTRSIFHLIQHLTVPISCLVRCKTRVILI